MQEHYGIGDQPQQTRARSRVPACLNVRKRVKHIQLACCMKLADVSHFATNLVSAIGQRLPGGHQWPRSPQFDFKRLRTAAQLLLLRLPCNISRIRCGRYSCFASITHLHRQLERRPLAASCVRVLALPWQTSLVHIDSWYFRSVGTKAPRSHGFAAEPGCSRTSVVAPDVQ